MGTNYHWFPEEIKGGTYVDSGLHLGKNSAGWVFQFEAHSEPCLKTVEQFREFTKKGVIYDEYDREISYEEFWQIVEESKEPYYGREPYVLEDPNYPHSSIEGIPQWVDEGFAFTESEFC